jgi:hypothetical protein
MSFETEALAGSPPAETGSAVGPQTETAGVGSSEAQQDVNGAGQRQSQAVPYERFQEVNSRYSALNQKAQALGYSSAEEYLTAAEQAYVAPEPTGYDYGSETSSDYDPTDALRKQVELQGAYIADLAFERAFSSLKERFPQARERDVRRSLMSGEYRTVDEAVEANHREREADRQAWLAERTQREEQRNSAGAEGAGGGQMTGAVDWMSLSSEDFDKRRELLLQQQRNGR